MSRPRLSAGILLYRLAVGGPEVLLILPGGPYWRSRDIGAWQIPKGAVEEGEDILAAALREFTEEVGSVPTGTPTPLGAIRQASGKTVEAFAVEGDLDAAAIVSNRFDMEWPPRSGAMQSFPEVERGEWFALDEARPRMLLSQRPLLDRLQALLAG